MSVETDAQTTLSQFGGTNRRRKETTAATAGSSRGTNLEARYLEDCRTRLSDYTVESHKTALEQFREFLGGKPVAKATKLDVRNFLNDLKERGRARSTISHRLSALRSFFDYIEEYLGVDVPDLHGIEMSDYPESEMEGEGRVALKKNEIRKLIETASSLRDTLIIAILYYVCRIESGRSSDLKNR